MRDGLSSRVNFTGRYRVGFSMPCSLSFMTLFVPSGHRSLFFDVFRRAQATQSNSTPSSVILDGGSVLFCSALCLCSLALAHTCFVRLPSIARIPECLYIAIITGSHSGLNIAIKRRLVSPVSSSFLCTASMWDTLVSSWAVSMVL
ncbi:hypothetical protein F5141DRAFT_439816 [Pisolithus sp. B1]|nr:hypothetical protein F5141DRAFT_439816 [Pisolithus sp. B1]